MCRPLSDVYKRQALRRVEAEYKASRPGYLVFLVDGYDDVFSDMLDLSLIHIWCKLRLVSSVSPGT